MSESVSKSPQYTPAAALASERILGSVLGRVAGSYSAPIGRTLQLADRVRDLRLHGPGYCPTTVHSGVPQFLER